MDLSEMNSFDLDDACREACQRARNRIYLEPMPVYEPRAADFDVPLWAMLGVLTLAVALLAWRLPVLLQIGVA